MKWTRSWARAWASEAQRVGPEGYIHGWIYVGPAAGKFKAESVELGPGVSKAHTASSDSELADLVEEHGHANFPPNSPRTERVRAELEKRGITTEAEPARDATGPRVHVFDVDQRRPAGENQGQMVLPARASRVADRIMADMSTVNTTQSKFTEEDLRGAERELRARLHEGGDEAVIKLRLRAIRARLKALAAT